MSSIKKETIILWFIKFAPAIFLIFIIIAISSYVSYEYMNTLKKEKDDIKKEYIASYKYRMKLNIETIDRYIQNRFINYKNDLNKELQEKITNIYNIALNIYEKNKNRYSKDQIINQIKDAIEPVRYDNGNGYFSIHTMDGINILHPVFKNLEGTKVINRTDIDGKHPVQEAIKIAKTKGEGSFTWHYFKPNNTDKHYKKFGFVKRFEPYNLIITTAMFEEDFQNQIKKEILNYLNILKYENNSYVFAINIKDKKPLTKLYNQQTSKSIFLSDELDKFIASKNKDIYLNYTFYDSQKEYSKLSYLLKTKQLDWIIGTGFNLDKINSKIENQHNKLTKDFIKNLKIIFICASLLIIFFLFISIYISKYLKRSFYSYKKEITKKQTQLADNYKQTIVSLVDLIEQRDFYTAGHSNRVASYAVKIAKAMDFELSDIHMLKQIGLLHDIGKIAIPDSILLKPGRLTKQEFDIIKNHSVIGYEVISKIPMFKGFSQIILSHHERYDGSGYPKGLKGDKIPVLASILSIADSFDAMTSTRIYNSTKSLQGALNELKRCSGTLFDPKIVKIAIEVLKDVDLTENIKATQMPKTPMEKERFAYFFKDNLTDTLNENYFELLFKQNLHHSKCLNFLILHNFSSYNEKFGWKMGNELLVKIIKQIKEIYVVDEIFRFQGAGFIILNKKHTILDINILNKELKKDNITCELRHFDVETFDDFNILMESLKR